MRHARPLSVEGLEDRELMSAVHRVRPHIKPAAVPVSLVLDGTLKVDNPAANTSQDDYGDMITTTPVSGQLGSMGAVKGSWSTGVDSMGDYLGPDTLVVHNAQGSVEIEFNDQEHGKPKRAADGSAYYQVPQVLIKGTGAYARASERGTLNLTTNPGHTAMVSITFNTGNT